MLVDPLRCELHRFAQLKERLLQEFGDIDDETLRDTLEGITHLHTIIAELIRSALTDQAMAKGLKARMEDMRARLQRLEERGKKKKKLALQAMSEADIPRLTEPDFTASVRKGQVSVKVVSEAEIPDNFWAPQPPRLDRAALTAALKAGDVVPGAALNPAHPVLTVRTK